MELVLFFFGHFWATDGWGGWGEWGGVGRMGRLGARSATAYGVGIATAYGDTGGAIGDCLWGIWG